MLLLRAAGPTISQPVALMACWAAAPEAGESPSWCSPDEQVSPYAWTSMSSLERHSWYLSQHNISQSTCYYCFYLYYYFYTNIHKALVI